MSGGSAGNAWLLGVIAGLATENAVFTDHIGEADVVGDFMPNLPFPVGEADSRLRAVVDRGHLPAAAIDNRAGS